MEDGRGGGGGGGGGEGVGGDICDGIICLADMRTNHCHTLHNHPHHIHQYQTLFFYKCTLYNVYTIDTNSLNHSYSLHRVAHTHIFLHYGICRIIH